MPTLEVVSLDKKKVGTVDLPDAVYGVKVNAALVHQVLLAQLAGRRQGTAKTKTKSEVRGGGRKPFRQKGTGNARQGSTRSPLQVGGGQNFGPIPRSYEQRTPKKMVKGALCSALSDRVKENRFLVVDAFDLKDAKTKPFFNQLKKNFKLDKTLIIDETNENLELSGRNIAQLKILRTDALNVYDIIKHEWILVSKKAAESIGERLSK